MAVKSSFQFANEILKDYIFAADNCERLFKMENDTLKNHLGELWQNAFDTSEFESTMFNSTMLEIENIKVLVIELKTNPDEGDVAFVAIAQTVTGNEYFTVTKYNKANKDEPEYTLGYCHYEFGVCQTANSYTVIDTINEISEQLLIELLEGYYNDNTAPNVDETSATSETASVPSQSTSDNNNWDQGIDFQFDWHPKDLDKITDKVMTLSKKLVDMGLVYVEPELSDEDRIVIRHPGLCRKQGLIDSLARGIVKEKPYWCTFSVRTTGSINGVCANYKTSTYSHCSMPSCPIWLAGYLWYLKHCKQTSVTADTEIIAEPLSENELFKRNQEKLESICVNERMKEVFLPLISPNIKGLRCCFIGNEGTEKERAISLIAKWLFDIGKTVQKNYTFHSLASLPEELSDDVLHVIKDLQACLEITEDNDSNSEAINGKQKSIKEKIKSLVNQSKTKYIIIQGTELEIKRFFTLEAKLPYIFEQKVYFDDLSDEAILKYFNDELPKYHQDILPENFNTLFLNYLGRNRRYFPFQNRDLSSFLAGYVSRKNVFELPKERYDNNSLENMLQNIVGMNNIKTQLLELQNYLKFRNYLDQLQIKLPAFNLHMMFLGNPGTGKTTIARMIAKILFDLGYIKENKCIEVESKDLIAAYTGQTAIKTGKVISKALGGVLFIDEAYSLAKDAFGAQAIATLIKAMEDYKDDLVVIFAGYSKEMQEFVTANSGISSRIGYTMEFADYTEDELYQIFELKAAKCGITVDEAAKQSLMEVIRFGRNRKNFGNGRYIDNLLQKTLIKHANFISDNNDDNLIIRQESIPTIEEIMTQASGERNPDQIEALFDEIVGMQKLKEKVIELGKYLEFRNKASKVAKQTLPPMNLHMLFTGDAGTGKTTMARKITEMLYNLGCIRINKLVEVDRKDLVGEHLGETAPKVNKVIQGALGGVLFIDEAYSLTISNSSNDYGHEAITTLIKAMEDHKDELVVIFAGYTKEMKQFVNTNSGIASRIGYTFEFSNYSDEELYTILNIKAKKFDFTITEKAKGRIMEVIKYYSSVENFGNGRFIDKLFQEITVKHAKNIKTDDDILKITEDDIPSIKEMVEITFSNRDDLVLPSDITETDRKIIAVHELGHAIVLYLLTKEVNIKVITVVPEGTGTLGYVLHERPKNKVHQTKKDYLNYITTNLAGRAAEELFFNDVSSGCCSDLSKATETAKVLINYYGMGSSIGLMSVNALKISSETEKGRDAEIKQLLDDCYRNALQLLQDNRALFDKVLDHLMTKGTITGETFLNLITEDNPAV